MKIRRCSSLICSSGKTIHKSKLRQSESGQIIIEYILLLLVAVTIAIIVSRAMIGSSKDNAGFVLQVWQQINFAIGSDHADDLKPPEK